MYLTREHLTQNEKGKFILIKDTSDSSGRRFLQALARTFLKELSTVKYLSYDLPSEKILKTFQFSESNWHLFDAYSNLLNFEPGENSISYLSPDVLKQISDSEDVVVFIDSVSSLLHENAVYSIYKSIYHFINSTTNSQSLVMLLHADSHPQDTNSIIESLATTTLEILPVVGEAYVFRSTVRYPSGKVSQEIWQSEIDAEGKFISMKEILPTMSNEPVKQPDPTANLPFNLKLTEDEKGVREKLQLPYTNVQEKKENVPIFSEEDFYDEDDPDDDLDI